MKNVIFFANNLCIGGLEKALVNLLNSFDFAEYSVTLVLEECKGELLEELNHNISVKEYKLSKVGFVPVRKCLNFAKRVLWLLRNYRRYDFACDYCTYSVIGSKLARVASDNTCIYIHSDYTKVYKDTEDVVNFFRTIEVEKFRSVVFVSNESKYNFDMVFPKIANKTFVINNIINYESVLAQSKQLCAISTAKTLFAFVGRLDEESKRISRLILAFKIAYEKNPNIKLAIIGDGKDREKYEKMIADNNLTGKILMLGQQNNPYPFMAAADCLVLTSDYEGFPVIYYEALVIDIRIVSTIAVSDDCIDIKDYAIITEKDTFRIAEAMANFESYEIKSLDFDEINETHMKALYALI